MTEAGPLTISALAARTGLRPDTVRYYERVGLMPEPARTSGDHRRYGALAVDRIRFIRGAQRLGLRLADIKDLLAVRDTGECPCEPAEPLLRSRIAEIDAELDRLTRLRADLVVMADQLPSATCPDPVPGPGAHPNTGWWKGGVTHARPDGLSVLRRPVLRRLRLRLLLSRPRPCRPRRRT